jgi:hypothetical protein
MHEHFHGDAGAEHHCALSGHFVRDIQGGSAAEIDFREGDNDGARPLAGRAAGFGARTAVLIRRTGGFQGSAASRADGGSRRFCRVQKNLKIVVAYSGFFATFPHLWRNETDY